VGTGGNTRFRNPTAVFIFAQSARVQLHLCVNQFAFKPFQHPGKVLKSNSVARMAGVVQGRQITKVNDYGRRGEALR